MEKTEVLKQYFGYSSFRSGQEKVVEAILEGEDALCVMPTGAGKSICYQVPALMFHGVTLVISPLISLMEDQVNALKQNGINAVYLNSTLTADQQSKVISGIKKGMYKIIYVAPERLLTPSFVNICVNIEIDLIAVDEAHCISQWGPNFRPSYLKIIDFVNLLKERPILAAFTATATEEVKRDIENLLELNDPYRITTTFDRPNLYFKVSAPTSKTSELLNILKRHNGESGIIYCSTRKKVVDVSDFLNENGFLSTIYHAGLDDETRIQNQKDFIYDRIKIMVATNAFGMGIDKSDTSFVIHYNMPKDMESYYQEAGRAGRDGSRAVCILLYSHEDVELNEYLIEHSDSNPELSESEQIFVKKREHDRLRKMKEYTNTRKCLRQHMLGYFGEKSLGYCGNCFNCLTNFIDADVTIEAQKILSCIRRTNEEYNSKMIIDILRGIKNREIVRRGFDLLSTYGLMSEYSESQIDEIIGFLESKGYIESKPDSSIIYCTSKARSVLLGEEIVIMKRFNTKQGTIKRREENSFVKKYNTSIDIENRKSIHVSKLTDRPLITELKELRNEIAKKKNLPAYMIFTDATLMDMCSKLPTTMGQFRKVDGVGKVKSDLYGNQFLQIIQKHNKKSSKAESKKYSNTSKPWTERNDLDITYLYHQGVSIDEISKIMKRHPDSVLERLKFLKGIK